MASTAWAAITSHDAPPTDVESIHRGRSPRYSLTSIGAIVPSDVDPTPSTSSLVRPASANAARLDRAMSSKGVPGAVPASATPAIATRRAITRPRSHALHPRGEGVESGVEYVGLT